MTASTAYPRPDFQRSALTWTSLDGPWDFVFDDQDAGVTELWQQKGIPNQSKRTIQVPYAFQTSASGIGLTEAHEVLWYERRIADVRTAEELKKGQRLILRFGAVDYECSIWVEGHFVGGHRGGHVPFDLDITDAISTAQDAKNAKLTVRVRDSPYDLAQPRGKQFWREIPENIWYTPTSGIWLSVWLESVPRMRLGGGSEGTILRSDDIEHGQLHAKVAVVGRPAGSVCSVEIEASIAGQAVCKTEKKELENDKDFICLDMAMTVPNPEELRKKGGIFVNDGAFFDNGVALWAPEHPILYDLTLRLYDGSGKIVDQVETTTGMRSLSWQNGDGSFRLNGKPYFQALVLDQGYWVNTGMTPPSQEALKTDIELSMNMGFNGCRKHQKVEDPLFLYWADRLGYLVWGEMASSQTFNDEYVSRFDYEWMEAMRRDINHPCIVTWTTANESWSYPSLKDNIDQRNHLRSLYYKTKTLDPSRPINDNCGWEHVLTDLTSYHDYADSAELAESCSKMEGGILNKKAKHDMFSKSITGPIEDIVPSHKPGAPVICTEFGGVNIAPGATESAGERDWGYTTASNPEDLLDRLEKLIMAVVKGGHSCGLVYTQLADVEQEVNGLYSFDRRAKIPASRVKQILDDAQKYYYEHVAPK